MPTRCLSRWIRHCRYNEVDCGTETSRTKSYFYMYVGSTRIRDDGGCVNRRVFPVALSMIELIGWLFRTN